VNCQGAEKAIDHLAEQTQQLARLVADSDVA
jgi:hypothetical protein